MNKQKKRLLITASTFPRHEADTEPRFILDYAQAISEYFEVTVLAPAAINAKMHEKIGNVNIIRYHYFPIHKWETLCYPGAIVPRIREKKVRILLVPFLFVALYWNLLRLLPAYDIVHANWLIPQGIVQSFFKKPYIITGHGGDVTSLNNGLFKILKKRCLKKAYSVTAVSSFLKEEMEKICPTVTPSIISMGVNINEFGMQYRVDNFWNQGKKKVILFVGRLAEKKGVTYLIEAMKHIDGLCVIVGDGPLKDSLQNQASDLLQDGKVIFLGSRTHEELKTIYASADIFVAPSVTAHDGDKEGLGLVILEAMASGLPIVANRSGGIVEVISDHISGLLCEEKNVKQLVDNINILLNDSDLYNKIRSNVIDAVKDYDYKVIAKKYSQLFD